VQGSAHPRHALVRAVVHGVLYGVLAPHMRAGVLGLAVVGSLQTGWRLIYSCGCRIAYRGSCVHHRDTSTQSCTHMQATQCRLHLCGVRRVANFVATPRGVAPTVKRVQQPQPVPCAYTGSAVIGIGSPCCQQDGPANAVKDTFATTACWMSTGGMRRW
jgi:hypothetical protein